MRRLGPLLAFLLLVLAAVTGTAAENTAVVRVAGEAVVSLRAPLAGQSPDERAAFATRVLAESLIDPRCDPQSFEVTEPEVGVFRIGLCGRSVLSVSAADAAAEGSEPAALAERWTRSLREAWTAHKARLYSRKLLEAALLGVVYPLLFLLVVAGVRLIVKRVTAWVEGLGGAHGLRIGPVLLTAEAGDRGLLSRLVRLLGWAVYLLIGYVFLIAFLDRFPGTARWAREMILLLADLGRAAGAGLLGLVPRLLALAVLVVIARIVLGSVGRFFEQVRARKIRLDPLFTPDTAGPAEITARFAVVALFVLAAGLLVPGEAGTVLLVALALLGLALALGSRPLVENFLAGLVILYGRPFRTGDALRVGPNEGVIESKGFLFLRLRLRDERIAIVPNRRALLEDVRVVDAERALRLRVALRPLRVDCAPEGLFRHAAAEAGLRRDAGRVALVAVQDGALVYSAVWPLPPGSDAQLSRSGFMQSLVARAPGLGVEVLTAQEAQEP